METKKCKYCQEEIDESIDCCPYCGKKQDGIVKDNQQELNKETINNEKKQNNKIPMIICIGILIIVFIGSLIPIINHRSEMSKLRAEIKYGPDYEYIDTDHETFARVLADKLNKRGIKVSSIQKYKGSKWADTYRYDIELKNGEKVYLTSNNENTIERIICRGDPKSSKSSLGDVTVEITMILEPNTTSDDIDKLNNDFFDSENLNQMFGNDYRLRNLVYEWYWDSLNNEFFQVTIMPKGHYELINEKDSN